MKNKVLNLVARVTPYALILAVPVGFIIALLLQKVNIALYCLILGIPTIAAAIVILKIQKQDFNFAGSSILFPFNQQFLIKLFLIIFTIGVIITLLSALKSALFLILIVCLYCIILIQVFSKNPSPWVIITEIVFTLITLIYTITLTSAYYFGYTDIIPHASLATITSLSGHILPPGFSDYSYFPLYHIWIASASKITGFDSHAAIIFLTCPVYAVSVIFVYFLFNRLIKNQQIALLTCLLYSSLSIVVFYGTYVITRTMAFVGFIILLYLLYNSQITEIKNRGLIFKVLAIVISFYIILVHHVSTPMILLILIILLLCEWMVSERIYIKTNFTVLLMSIFIGYWLFFANTFTSGLIISRVNPQKFETLALLPTVHQNSPIFASFVFFINNVHMLIFLFFGIIGIFYILWRRKPEYVPVFGLFALLTILLYIPSPLQSIWQLKIFLSFDRIQLFVIPFLILMMAWGILVIIKFFEQIKIPIKIICFILVTYFFIYSCSSIGLIKYTENTSTRVSFNADELIGYNFLEKYVPADKRIVSDYFTIRYFSRPQEYEENEDPTGLFLTKGYFAIPKKQFLSEGLLFSKGTETDVEGGTYSYLPTNENIQNLYRGLYPNNQIYSSNSLDLYVNNKDKNTATI